jgi:hypothetical protein
LAHIAVIAAGGHYRVLDGGQQGNQPDWQPAALRLLFASRLLLAFGTMGAR